MLLLFWRENSIMSFLPSLNSVAVCSAEHQPHAYFHFKSTTEWSAGQIIYYKVFWEASYKNRQQEQNALDEYVPVQIIDVKKKKEKKRRKNKRSDN